MRMLNSQAFECRVHKVPKGVLKKEKENLQNANQSMLAALAASMGWSRHGLLPRFPIAGKEAYERTTILC